MTSWDSLRESVVDRIAAQWVALGGQITDRPEQTVIDLEALVAISAVRAKNEPRVQEVAVDWCVPYGTILNLARLKTVAREVGIEPQELGRFGAAVVSSGGPHWPFAIGSGTPRHRVRNVVVDELSAPSRLVWRIRSAFGVNARSDVLAVLMTVPAVPVSVADLSRRTRFSKRNVALAVASMRLAGVVAVTRTGNEDRIRLDPSSPLRDWLEPDGVPDIDWAARWTVANRLVVLAEAMPSATPAVRVVESRVVIKSMLPLLGPAALPRPDLTVVGPDLARVIDAWAASVGSALRRFDA